MSEPKLHKHADLIIAWANGAEIQVQIADKANEWLDTQNPLWHSHNNYRIKPKIKKGWYRVLTFIDGTVMTLSHRSNEETIEYWVSHPLFSKYLTDKIEFEYEE